MDDTQKMTHDDLVARAVRWLLGSKKCKVVLGDRESICWSISEQPDAIGWTGYKSFLVECKTSINDFYADRRKLSRKKPAGGIRKGESWGTITKALGAIGEFRYYLCEPGIIPASKIPEPWGLLHCLPKIIRVIKPASRNSVSEWGYPERSLLAAKLSWAQKKLDHVREKEVLCLNEE